MFALEISLKVTSSNPFLGTSDIYIFVDVPNRFVSLWKFFLSSHEFWVLFLAQRLIVLQLLSIGCQEAQGAQADERNWSNELYEGEFNDLNTVELLCRERFQPFTPRIRGFQSNNPATEQISRNPTRETLHV